MGIFSRTRDIVAANFLGATELWMSTGTGFAYASHLLPVWDRNSYANSVTVADTNEDGWLDIVLSQSPFAGQSMKAFANRAGQWFENTYVIEVPESLHYELHTSDLDADGDPDLIVGGRNGALQPWTVKVLFNTHRQTLARTAPVRGQPYLLELWAQRGQILVPALAAAPGRTPLGSWGILGLDLASLQALAPIAVTTERNDLRLPIPTGAYLAGRTICAQTFVLDVARPQDTRLSNTTCDVIQ